MLEREPSNIFFIVRCEDCPFNVKIDTTYSRDYAMQCTSELARWHQEVTGHKVEVTWDK